MPLVMAQTEFPGFANDFRIVVRAAGAHRLQQCLELRRGQVWARAGAHLGWVHVAMIDYRLDVKRDDENRCMPV